LCGRTSPNPDERITSPSATGGKLLLPVIAAIGGIGDCADQFAALGDFGQKLVVVKVGILGLATGVVDVLHIDKQADFLWL
jgi:hypothetical protein